MTQTQFRDMLKEDKIPYSKFREDLRNEITLARVREREVDNKITVTEGEIKIGGKNVVGMIPRERDVAMVFQNYALFPHLDVFGNLSFGLRLRKVPKEQVAEKVRSAAKILDIEHLYWNASPRNFLEVSVSELRSAEPSSENLRSF